jgi:zinc transporter ZupT
VTRLPRWAWLLPATAAVGAVLVWTIWGSTQRGTLIGAVLIAATGVLVCALALEALPRSRSGAVATAERTALAAFLGLVAGIATLAVAGLGYYLEYRPFG